MEFEHRSVLLYETVDALRVKPDGVYMDGTLGGGGHSCEICKRLGKNGRLYGIDQDADAVKAASERLSLFEDRVMILRDNYCNAVARLRGMGVDGADGIVLDLGVSSHQLDTVSRGFSYKQDAPLDMRMDDRQTLTAREIVNEYSEAELYRMIRDYGEEQFAKNIAKHIAAARKDKPLETTGELCDIIKASIPAKLRTNGHPAKKTFQAIRIACNHELDVLENSLDEMIAFLKPGGRIAIITFHSLEDRIVKAAFRRNENPCSCPPDFPVCVCGKKATGRQVNRKPILPGSEELETNKRSKSAKLRIFEKSEK